MTKKNLDLRQSGPAFVFSFLKVGITDQSQPNSLYSTA